MRLSRYGWLTVALAASYVAELLVWAQPGVALVAALAALRGADGSTIVVVVIVWWLSARGGQWLAEWVQDYGRRRFEEMA